MLASALMFTLCGEAHAGIGRVGPPEYYKTKKPMSHVEAYYRENYPQLFKKKRKKKGSTREITLYFAMPSPERLQKLMQANAAVDSKTATEEPAKNEPKAPGIPGLTGKPGLGGR